MWVHSASVTTSNDEVVIDSKRTGVKKKEVKTLIEAFLASSDDLKEYSVIEIYDNFIVGILQPTEKLLRHACDMCGCITDTEVELIIHRQTHAGHF
jgi:hypothetical protein